MLGKGLPLAGHRATSIVSQLQSISRKSFASEKLKGFSEATSRFTNMSFEIKRDERTIKTRLAKELFQALITTDPLNKKSTLHESLITFEKQNPSVKDIAIYSGNGNKMPMDSLAWHINMGNSPYYPAHPETVDMHQVIQMLKKSISSEAHLLIEERGTLNGSNLVHMVTELQESFNGITGIGSDINLPSLAIGIATNNYIGTQDYIKIGFGSAFAISTPIPSMTKAVCLFNLISILSPKHGLMALDSAAKSLKTGDLLILTIHINNEKTIKHHVSPK